LIETLKQKAKEQKLWNLFIPLESDPEAKYGAGLRNLEYAFLAEIMGSSPWSSEVFNCSAPDTGNMEVLLRYGSSQQKEKWLKPLLNGEIRSCFGMTEPGVASSDATNIETLIVREGDSYRINGHKWWTSGANDSRCKVCILMGKTPSVGSNSQHLQHSMILVPMDSPGVFIKRHLEVFGYDDAPHGHAEVIFKDVIVPAENMILGEGKGFEISQGRLGPGRIHHCMRSIGVAERSLQLLIHRAAQRKTFGRLVLEHGTVLADVANSRIEIDQARLLTLQAAKMMDELGNKEARQYIAMIKVVAPNVALRVIDRAIQVHGGAGVSQDFPLSYFWAGQRALRLADGPDEVHRLTIARLEISKQRQRAKL